MLHRRTRWACALLAALLGSAPGLGSSQPADTARPRVVGQKNSLPALGRLRTWVLANGGKLSALVVDLQDQREVASFAPGASLNPASNQKLLLMAGAFAILGPNYQFSTGVYGAIREGEAAPLVLRGNGDPSLRTENLWRLAELLVGLGLVRVTGPVLVDQSAFDENFLPPAFDQQPNESAAFRAPVSALALDGNTVTLRVLSTEPGKAARVWYSPPGFVTPLGEILTRPKGKGRGFSLELQPQGPRLEAKVSGFVGAGQPLQVVTRRVEDPRLVAGYVFKYLLEQRGVRCPGGVELGGAGETRRMAGIRSEPLARLAFEIGKESDNFYAEMLLKAVGARASQGPGSSAAGARAIENWLKVRGLWVEGTEIKNGSGLFDANRLSAQQIVNVLAYAEAEPAMAPEFLSQLAVAGRDGTLHARFPKERSSGAVRAKTGTLARADALSGYVLSRGRARFAFSLLVNGVNKHPEARKLIDAVVEELVELSQLTEN